MTQPSNITNEFLPIIRKLEDNTPRLNIYTADISVPTPPELKIIGLEESLFSADTKGKVFLNSKEGVEILDTLNMFIEKLDQHATFLYSYRSMQTVFEYAQKKYNLSDEERANIEAEFKKVYIEKMQPKIKIIREVVDDWENADNFLIDLGGRISWDEGQYEQVLFEKMMQLIDCLFSVEYTKLIRTPINGDISCFFKWQVTKNEEKEIQIKYNSRNFDFREEKKKKMSSPKHRTFYLNFLEWIMREYERINRGGNEAFINYHKKYSIANCVIYILKSTNNIPDFLKNKRKLQNDIISLFKEVPHVPVQFDIFYSPSVDIKLLLEKYDDVPRNVKQLLEHIRIKYGEILSILSRSQSGFTMDVIIRIYNFLSYISFCLKQQFVYRLFLNPIQNNNTKDSKNLNEEELQFMVECISYMKIVVSEVLSLESDIFKKCISKVHKDIQQFIKNELDHPLFHAYKSNNNAARSSLEYILAVFGNFDRSTNKFQIDIYKTTKDIPEEKIDGYGSTTPHHLDILRILLFNLAQNKDLKKRVFKDKHIGQINNFLEKVSGDYYIYLDYIKSIKNITNIGYLYFKEFSLSQEKGKKLFFEIQTSLPHKLCKYITKSNSSYTFDYLFFPFEIYNDAANIAMYKFKFYPHYKEIQMEGHICSLMVKTILLNELMSHIFHVAAYTELPGEISIDFLPDSRRFDLLFNMNSFTIAGKDFNFSTHLTRDVNNFIIYKLRETLRCFNEFRNATYASYMIRVIKSAHRILRLNHVHLDDFNMIWNKVNDFQFPTKLSTYLTDQMRKAIKFEKMKLSIITKRYTIKGNSSPSNNILGLPNKIHSLFASDVQYIGLEHVRAIITTLQQSELSLLIKDTEKEFERLFKRFANIYSEIVEVINVIAPQQTDDVSTFYNFCFDAYESITDNKNLEELLKVMTSIGNLFAFLWFLDNELGLVVNRNQGFTNKTVLNNIFTLTKSFIKTQYDILEEDSVNVRNFTRHKTFASMWSVIEFLFISYRKDVGSDENSKGTTLINKNGDGALLFAHILINLCGQDAIYKYDSIVQRLIRMNFVKGDENRSNTKGLIKLCSVCDQCRLYSEIITRPYVE